MKRIYLDYAATTPVDPRVLRAMQPYFSARFGNPGSLHAFGQEASAAVDLARERIARVLGAEFREVVFTGSATEANNLALRGALAAARSAGFPRNGRPRIILSSLEHESVWATAQALAREGAELVLLPADQKGIVRPDDLRAALNRRTVLVSVMYGSNEIGAAAPVPELAEILHEFRKREEMSAAHGTGARASSQARGPWPLFHTDAVQAFAYLPCDVRALRVDFMTVSAHKICGPKGIGALFIRGNRVSGFEFGKLSPNLYTLAPIITGGGQEFGVRSGTENVPAIAGFAEAVELAAAVRVREAARVRALRDGLVRGIRRIYPRAEANGSQGASGLPHIANVYFPGLRAEELLTKLDLLGVAVSAGPACSSRSPEPSRVLLALGCGRERAARSVRMSVGRQTTAHQIGAALRSMKRGLSELRASKKAGLSVSA